MKRIAFILLLVPALFLLWQAGDYGVSNRADAVASEVYACGDVNIDGDINMLDMLFIMAYLYKSGPAPQYPNLADADYSGVVNLLDILYLIAYQYKNGPVPSCPPELADPAGSLTGTLGCKGMSKRGETPSNLDCVEYQYDGVSTLYLKHVNAGFNCCPVIHGDVEIADNIITITEYETFDSTGPCYCLCLFDVDYEIVNLPPGEYTINVIGLYVNEGDDSLKFTVNLSTGPEGSYCVERQYYPWGTYPTGELINHTGCLSGPTDRDTLDQDCLIYEYDGVSTLLIRHVNDLFNCCPDYLYANITIDNNYIYIEEWEAIGPSGGCDCICLYNLEYEIVNLPPGEYTVEVNNPHYYNTYGGGQSIGFTGEFWEVTSGVVCVDRPYYLPWWR